MLLLNRVRVARMEFLKGNECNAGVALLFFFFPGSCLRLSPCELAVSNSDFVIFTSPEVFLYHKTKRH